MFKFVHIADSHLESTIVSNEKDKELILNKMEKESKASISLCINKNCDALLIWGLI